MSVFGYIRFSYFGRNDTKLSRYTPDNDARFSALFAPARMEERFYFFENLTLPSLRAQTDQDFKVLVLASTIMPDSYKARLEAAVADIPQVSVAYSDKTHVKYALAPHIRRFSDEIPGRTVHFRLDDDDAISAGLVAELRDTLPRARRKELISFPHGMYLTTENGVPKVLRKFEPYIAIGFAFVNEPGMYRNPYDCRHHMHHRLVPSSLDPRPLAYIHCAHVASDSRENQDKRLNIAKRFDPDHATEAGRADNARRIAEAFPAFTLEGLEDLMRKAPSARDSAHTQKMASTA